MRDCEIDERSLDSAEENGYERGYNDAIQQAWDRINNIIKKGMLSEPQHSERNGLILAANEIFRLRKDGG